jgi:tetratricopeptide (TPR) repeat protein
MRKWLTVLWVGLSLACSAANESEMFEAAVDGPSAKARIESARTFLDEFPESLRRREVARKLFTDGLEAKDESAALQGAEAYLAATESDRRDRLGNQLAWRLAEAGLGLERAESLAREVVAAARAQSAPELRSYLDTLAFVLYRRDRAAEAEPLQAEAVALGPGNAGMLGRLALYQYAAGKHSEAIFTAADAILQGAGGEISEAYRRWVSRPAGELTGEGNTLRDVISPKVQAFLMESDTPFRRSLAAHLYALSGIELETAERWALEHLASETDRDRLTQGRVILAAVQSARGDYRAAVETLLAGRAQATPFDSSFWLALGHNFRLDDRPMEAEEALLTPLLVRDETSVRSELRELGLTEDEIDNRVEQRRQDLLRFHPGRYGGEPTGRVVLAELFTGAECNPCQAADYAFDLLTEYYPRSMLVILEHHVHIPGADPLTNRDTEGRYQFYGGGLGTPTTFFNGERVSSGGPALLKKSVFQEFDAIIRRQVAEPPAVQLQVAGGWKDADTVHVEAIASSPAELRPAVFRFALVERSVRYRGGNGVNPHAWVVRSLAGGEGLPLQMNGGTAQASFQLNVTEVEKGLADYLSGFEANPPERYKGFGGFREKPVRIDRSQLGAVVWVQETESKQVLQAAYFELGS